VQGGVRLRRDQGFGVEGEFVGDTLDDETALRRVAIAVGAERRAVEGQRDKGQGLAVEMERRARRSARRIAADREARFDPGVVVAELED